VPLQVTPIAKHQDNSSSKAEQQDTNTKLRTARDRLQAQLRQLQELHLTEAKVSQGQGCQAAGEPMCCLQSLQAACHSSGRR
jgi:hypothetical protein